SSASTSSSVASDHEVERHADKKEEKVVDNLIQFEEGVNRPLDDVSMAAASSTPVNQQQQWSTLAPPPPSGNEKLILDASVGLDCSRPPVQRLDEWDKPDARPNNPHHPHHPTSGRQLRRESKRKRRLERQLSRRKVRTYWNALPIDLLESIFRRLSVKERHVASQVCPHWFECFYSPSI